MSKYSKDINYLYLGVDISKEEIGEVITEAEQIITEGKNSERTAEAYLKKSQCLQKLGKYQESRESVECALQLCPSMNEAIIQSGNIFLEDKEYDEAIARYTKSIHFKPNYAVTFIYRALAYDKKGEKNKALSDYTEAKRIEPDFIKRIKPLRTIETELDYIETDIATGLFVLPGKLLSPLIQEIFNDSKKYQLDLYDRLKAIFTPQEFYYIINHREELAKELKETLKGLPK